MRKIAFFSMFPLEKCGGLERYYMELSKNLMMHEGDLKITIITPSLSFFKKVFFYIKIYYFFKIQEENFEVMNKKEIDNDLGDVQYLNFASFNELRTMLKDFHLIYSKNEILEAIVLKFFVGYKNINRVILGVATSPVYLNVFSFESIRHNFLYGSFLYKFLIKDIHTIQVKNKYDYDLYTNKFPDKKVVLIYNTFDDSSIKRNKDNKINGVFIDKEKFNIIWVGRFTAQKGITDLIEIINKVNAKPFSKKINWIIVGDGDMRDKILKLRELFKNVYFLGYIKNENIPWVLSYGSLFISTSKWETFGNNIIEAQIMNLPVLSYNIHGPKDIIIPKETGILVNNQSEFILELERIYNNDYAFLNVSEKIVKKFSREKIYDQFNNLFSI